MYGRTKILPVYYRTSSPLGLLPKREANSSKTPGGDQNFIFAVGSPQANDTISICVGFQLVPVVSHRIITGFSSNSLKNLTLFFLKTGGNQIFFYLIHLVLLFRSSFHVFHQILPVMWLILPNSWTTPQIMPKSMIPFNFRPLWGLWKINL